MFSRQCTLDFFFLISQSVINCFGKKNKSLMSEYLWGEKIPKKRLLRIDYLEPSKYLEADIILLLYLNLLCNRR